MNLILQKIRNSKKKHKDLVTELTNEVKKDKQLFPQLIESLEVGSDVEKGTIAEVLKYVTAEKPEYALPHIKTLIKYINYKAPRVMWGVPETIGHIGRKFPEKVEAAIPRLLINTENESTVIRWCAAFALTEIAKSDPKIVNELLSKLEAIVKKEKNNGVKNVYLKTLKIVRKA